MTRHELYVTPPLGTVKDSATLDRHVCRLRARVAKTGGPPVAIRLSPGVYILTDGTRDVEVTRTGMTEKAPAWVAASVQNPVSFSDPLPSYRAARRLAVTMLEQEAARAEAA
jgi:hypothetical protein